MSNYLFTKYPLEHFLLVAAVIFCCGLYTIITRKNAVSILMGVELVLNSANINFIAFSRYTIIGMGLEGPVFAIFVIVLAAAEAAVALAIIIGIYQNFGEIDVDRTDLMKE